MLQNASVQSPFDPFSALVSPTVKHLHHIIIREHNVVTRRVQNLFPFVQEHSIQVGCNVSQVVMLTNVSFTNWF